MSCARSIPIESLLPARGWNPAVERPSAVIATDDVPTARGEHGDTNMAADWLPIRVDLPNDPRVLVIADALQLDPDTVVGKLVRVWGWAGAHSSDGRVRASADFVDSRVAFCAGFVRAMASEKCGWAALSDGKIEFPRWAEWNASCAKTRLKARDRQRKTRHRNVTEMSRSQRDKSATTETEQTQSTETEEKYMHATASLPKNGRDSQPGACEERAGAECENACVRATDTLRGPPPSAEVRQVCEALLRLGVRIKTAAELARQVRPAAFLEIVRRGRAIQREGKLRGTLAAYVVGAIRRADLEADE